MNILEKKIFKMVCIMMLASGISAQVEYEVPGRLEYCKINENGVSVLPSGRFVSPVGEKIRVHRAPYGLAVSDDGKFAVVLHSGAVTLVEMAATESLVRRFPEFDGKGVDIIKGASFVGASFSNNNRVVYLSGGDKGKIWMFDVILKKVIDSIDVNQFHNDAPKEAFVTDILVDDVNDDLWVLDRAWFQLYRIGLKNKQLKAMIPTGRIPFGLALSAKNHKLLVANVGMYAYPVVPGVNEVSKDSFLLHFPAYGAHSKESIQGVEREGRFIPGLGDPNADESMSVWIVNTLTNTVTNKIKTGTAIGEFIEDLEVVGGSHPNSIVCDDRYAYVSQAGADDIAVIDLKKSRLLKSWPIRTSSILDDTKGYMPYGLDIDRKNGRLYVALLGYNAVAALELKSGKNLGMIPAGWGATRVKCNPVTQELLITSARGYGAGPNGGVGFKAPPQGTYIGDIQLGLLQRVAFPTLLDLEVGRKLTVNYTMKPVVRDSAVSVFFGPNSPIKHIVYITKENRTYDEVFGQLGGGLGDSSLSRFGVNCEYTLEGQLKMIHNDQQWKYPTDSILRDSLKRLMKGLKVTPNHHKIARQFSFSDNFYCDSDASIHGHHWMLGTMPNEYVETNSANAGDFMTLSKSPGRRMPRTTGAMDPEDYNQVGGFWEAIKRSKKSIYNFGEANEYSGVREEWFDTLNGTGMSVVFPMPAAIYNETSRNYAGYNTSIPDQFRVEQFETEFTEKWLNGQDSMPDVITIQLPNDHTSQPRPADGYPYVHSYVADNDLGLGRILHFLSHTPYWRNMLVIVTEDDPQGGVDHIDAHRSLLLMAGPYVKKGYISHTHANFGSIIRTMYDLMEIPAVNHFDATGTLLADWFTTNPDFTPYELLRSDVRIFNPDDAMLRYNHTIPWREVKMLSPMDEESDQKKQFYENHN